MNTPTSEPSSKGGIGIPSAISTNIAGILMDVFEGVKKKCIPGNLDGVDINYHGPISQKEVYYTSMAFSQADMLGSSFRDPVLNNLILDNDNVLLKMVFKTSLVGDICSNQRKIKTIEYHGYGGKLLARKFDSYV